MDATSPAAVAKAASAMAEVGTPGLRRTGGVIATEYLPQLRGHLGRKTMREMAENDPVISGMLLAVELVLGRVPMRVEPYSEPDKEPTKDAEDAARLVEECLDDMNQGWEATLSDIMTMGPFGWSFLEIVYKKRVGPEEKDPSKRSKYTDGKIGWRKWALRDQDTLLEWKFDDDGGLRGLVQQDPYNPKNRGAVTIPIEKALLFRTTTRGTNPEGRSLLRGAYRSWYFKRRIEEIEATGIERDLVGLPVAGAPPEYFLQTATPAQKATLAAIQELVTSIRRNEEDGVVWPLQYDDNGNELFTLKLLSTGGSRQFDTDKIISRYDQRIAMNVLADFMLLGHEGVGSFALGSSKIDLFTAMLGTLAKGIADVVNRHAIPRLLRLNGMKLEHAPSIVFGDVSHVDLSAMADFVSKLVAAGAMIVDDALEEFLRDLAKLPKPEHDGIAANQEKQDQLETQRLAAMAKNPLGPDGQPVPPPKDPAKAPGGAQQPVGKPPAAKG